MFDAAGVGAGLTRINAVPLYLGMKKLANKEPLQSVRLFGKIMGTKRDYLICECQYTEDYAEPEPEGGEEVPEGEEAAGPKKIPMEDPKTGINTYVYYVAGWIEGEEGAPGGRHDIENWTKLPHVKPECLMVARKIKKVFTGILDTPIQSYPPFPGNEADYLRCQLARIAAGATLCLNGMFKIDPEAEEPNTVVLNEANPDEGIKGFEPATATVLEDPAEWVHHPMYPSILSGMGRCKEPEGEPLDDEDAEAKRLAAIEQGIVPLKTSAADCKLGKDMPAWSARKCSPVLRDHSVSMIRSNRWPGAMCVAQGAQFANIYVGDGHKYSLGGFQPFAPPMLYAECPDEDAKEQADESVPLPPPPEPEGDDA